MASDMAPPVPVYAGLNINRELRAHESSLIIIPEMFRQSRTFGTRKRIMTSRLESPTLRSSSHTPNWKFMAGVIVIFPQNIESSSIGMTWVQEALKYMTFLL